MKRWCLTLGLAAACWPYPARADWVDYTAEIICGTRGNVALVRFGTSESGAPPTYRRLPRTVDDGLSAAPRTGRNDCRMANGWALRIRSGQGQERHYGWQGGDVNAFFSLWIERRRVVSRREWRPGTGATYFQNAPALTGLVIRPDRLTWCEATERGPQQCRSEPLRLGRRQIDLTEYPRSGRKWREGTLLASRVSAPPGFCGSYARGAAPYMDDLRRGAADLSPFAYEYPERRVPVPRGIDMWVSAGRAEIAPGDTRQIIRWRRSHRFFDGGVVLIVPVGVDAARLVPGLHVEEPERTATLRLLAGWSRLVGGEDGVYPQAGPRYVNFQPQRVDGQLVFLAYPTNLDERPTAFLIGVRPEGGTRILCRLQIVEPHF